MSTRLGLLRPTSLLVLLLVFTLFAATLVHTPLVHAATTWNITPSSACTLADAITANNTGAISGSCAAGTGSTGIINLAAGTYTLGANLPSVINNNLNIVGAGVGSTIIDGQNQYTVFTDSTGNLSGVSNLTINHAGNGGSGVGLAIFAEASTVSISNVVVENSTVDGGIDVRSFDASITNVAIFSNAGNGFALRLAPTNGTYNVTNVTVYGNRNGVYIDANGSGTVNFTNDTIASNTGAGINFHIGGGSPTVNVKNIILANSTNCAGSALTSQGHTISSDNSCGFVGTSNHSSTDPELGSPTASSGTYALPITYTSAAYDSGDPTGAPSTDQRGVARPQCSGVDIGAYETTTCTPAAPSGGSGSGSSGSGTSSSSSSSSKKSSGASTASNSTTSAAASPATSTSASKSSQSTRTTKSSGGGQVATVATSKPASHTGLIVGGVVILLAAAAVGGWFYLRQNPALAKKLHLPLP
jgi:hypothetical protein